jgi:uncharacterized phage protein (TIGR02218 family)
MAFRAELRSAQPGAATRGRIYQGLRDAVVGNTRCGVNLTAPAFRGFARVTGVEDDHRVRVVRARWIQRGLVGFGTAQWTGGRPSGLRDGVVTHQRVNGGEVVAFGVAVGDWVVMGDTLEVTAGCDRRLATCRETCAYQSISAAFRIFQAAISCCAIRAMATRSMGGWWCRERCGCCGGATATG